MATAATAEARGIRTLALSFMRLGLPLTNCKIIGSAGPLLHQLEHPLGRLVRLRQHGLGRADFLINLLLLNRNFPTNQSNKGWKKLRRGKLLPLPVFL